MMMFREAFSMDDDDGDDIYNEGSQVVPSCTLDNVVNYNTSTTKPIKGYCIPIDNNHVYSSESMFQEISSRYTCNVPIPMQCPVQEDFIYEKTNKQLLKHESQIEMAEVPDGHNELDEHCLLVHRDQCLTTSNTSNYDQTEKPLIEIFDKQISYFPNEHVNFSTGWHLYRIIISNNNDLGFIAPCESIKLPMFKLYEHDDQFTVQLMYIGSIDYRGCENQLENFCQYVFEEVFNDMNTGSKSTLKFDFKGSTFKLLPCLLKQSGELDYERMASICNRKYKLIQNSSEINDQELYTHLNSPNKQFYMNVTAASFSKQAYDPRKDCSMVAMKRFEKPNINYFKKRSLTTNKELNSPATKLHHYSIGVLRYAPLSQIDFELIYKLPSILVRISQLYYIEQLRKLLADNSQSYSLLGVDQMPIVTFGDCLSGILSSNRSTVLPLASLNYDLLFANNCEHQPSPDLLFQSITQRVATENTNLETLEILGDCFLKLAMSMSLYHQYPSDDVGELTKKRSPEISNEHLYQISVQKGLKHYLNSIKTIFCGKNANWIPPGFIVDEENAERYNKQESKLKPFADMIEALIGVFLISTNYSTTIKFMHWLGLDVVPIDDHNCIVKKPSILRIDDGNDINEIANLIRKIYNERSFIEIETKIKYEFKDKAYLIAAFTHPSRSNTTGTIDYKRLKFVGNALLEFLITRYIFVTRESTTSGHITNVRQDLSQIRGAVMVANDLQKKIIYSSPKLINPILSNITDKDLPIDEKNVTQWADSTIPEAVANIFEALIGAIFFDSNYSLKVVWDVIDLLLRQYTDLDYLIEYPKIDPVRLIHEMGGKITDESIDLGGNFICSLKLLDGTEVKGYGKSKKLAKQNASKKVKK